MNARMSSATLKSLAHSPGRAAEAVDRHAAGIEQLIATLVGIVRSPNRAIALRPTRLMVDQ